MIIMISGAVLGGPGPGPKAAGKEAGRSGYLQRERVGQESGVTELGLGVGCTDGRSGRSLNWSREVECAEGRSQPDPRLVEVSGPAPLGFCLQTPGNFGTTVKPY